MNRESIMFSVYSLLVYVSRSVRVVHDQTSRKPQRRTGPPRMPLLSLILIFGVAQHDEHIRQPSLALSL